MMSVRSQLDALTRLGLSKATGVSLSHISLVIDRKRTPSIGVVKKIAAALGCSTEDLLSFLGLELGVCVERRSPAGGRIQAT